MSDEGRREARLITTAVLILGGSGIASSVSPTIESVLNVWVGVPVAVLGGGWLAWQLVRWVWSLALIEYELRRRPRPEETRRPGWERPHA